LEVELIHKSGDVYWVEIKARFIKEAGKRLKIVGITREITGYRWKGSPKPEIG